MSPSDSASALIRLFQFPIPGMIKGVSIGMEVIALAGMIAPSPCSQGDIITVGLSLSSAVAAESRSDPHRLLHLAFNDTSGVHDQFG
jgi:hypothetical protein